jgi:hypothetical protein
MPSRWFSLLLHPWIGKGIQGGDMGFHILLFPLAYFNRDFMACWAKIESFENQLEAKFFPSI